MDCASDDRSCSLVAPNPNNLLISSPLANEADCYCSLIEPCGTAVIVDQVNAFVGLLSSNLIIGGVNLYHFVKWLVPNFQCSFPYGQIKVPHPDYPSTCISVQVPNLAIHFSPSRYRRLMELLNIFYGATEISGQPAVDSFQATLASWDTIDLASNARILVWKVC